MSISGNFLTTPDGTKLSYTETGSPAGQPILFLTGWRFSAATWKPQLDHFGRAGYRAIAYDHRGQGNSDKTSKGMRVAQLAVDLATVITKLNVSNIFLVGHSMAVTVIFAFWSLFPEKRSRVSGIVFFDQSTRMVADPAWAADTGKIRSSGLSIENPFQFAAKWRSEEDLDFQTQVVSWMLPPHTDTAMRKYLLDESMKMPGELAALLFIDQAFSNWDDVVEQVDVPALVITTKSYTPNSHEAILRMAERLPRATVKDFSDNPNTCHFISVTDPKAFNGALEGFFRSVLA